MRLPVAFRRWSIWIFLFLAALASSGYSASKPSPAYPTQDRFDRQTENPRVELTGPTRTQLDQVIESLEEGRSTQGNERILDEDGGHKYRKEIQSETTGKIESYCKFFSCNSEQNQRNLKFFFNPNWCKCTPRRCVGFMGLAALYGGAAVVYSQYGLSILSSYSASVSAAVFINGFETMLNMVSLFSSVPKKVEPTPKKLLKKLAVIIPVHGKDKDIEPSIQSLIDSGIGISQIFVIENTGKRYTLSESRTFSLLKDNPLYKDVKYHYIDAWGSKVAAEYLGGISAAKFGFKYMMAIDDDVIVPKHFDPYLRLINDRVKLIAYPIEPSNNVNYGTQMQKQEYRTADIQNYFKANLGTALSAHGAISVADLGTYLRVMRDRPVNGSFSSEDQKKSMAFRWDGSDIAMAPGVPIGTEVPEDCAVLWGQRVGSWNTGAQLMSDFYTEDLLTDCPQNCDLQKIPNSILKKVYQFQLLFTNVSEIVRPVIGVSFAGNWYFWAVVCGVTEANILIGILDDSFIAPHRNRERVCASSTLWKSCGNRHAGCLYSAFQLAMGSVGACCACIGAGAADDVDYGLKAGYPSQLRELIDIDDEPTRFSSLVNFLTEIGPDPRAEGYGVVPQASGRGLSPVTIEPSF